ncbi:LPD25 domain-containing protein [Thalassobacillus sp. C254]|uniref:LPD25 domain-containing protein n=1 Tax=Thalassobacillus sp. C254 TaxID=1225341 RepID=UPI0006D1A03A|nr:hypothetical protein [Thalassobacillus sp. C254]
MTAYTVASHFNIDTSEYSLQYLDNYTRDERDIGDKLELLEEVKGTSYKFITHVEEDMVKAKDKEYETTEDVQDRFGHLQVIMRNEVKPVSDLSPEEFKSTFQANDGRNILQDKQFENKSETETIQTFNALESNWNGSKDNVKLMDPSQNEPQFYVVWSEKELNQNMMNAKEMNTMLAKENLHSLGSGGYDKTKINMVDSSGVQTIDRIDLGDGHYHDLRSHVQQTNPQTAKQISVHTDALQGIYTKEALSQTIESNYREHFYQKDRKIEDPHDITLSDLAIQTSTDFALDHQYLSPKDIQALKKSAEENVSSHVDEMNTTNSMVHLKGHYTTYTKKPGTNKKERQRKKKSLAAWLPKIRITRQKIVPCKETM